jgi:Uma2 family endonuclease
VTLAPARAASVSGGATCVTRDRRVSPPFAPGIAREVTRAMLSPMPQGARKLATADDLTRLGDEPFEVIRGDLVRKAAPSAAHGDVQSFLAALLKLPFQRRAAGGAPGGWWILTEVEIELDTHEVYRPDLSGWRRARAPERPKGRPVRARPDWVCEVLSPTTAKNDLVEKLRTFHLCGVPHYWIADPEHETLTVHRWTPEGFLTALTAKRGDHVRAEPFDAIELNIGTVFGDEE